MYWESKWLVSKELRVVHRMKPGSQTPLHSETSKRLISLHQLERYLVERNIAAPVTLIMTSSFNPQRIFRLGHDLVTEVQRLTWLFRLQQLPRQRTAGIHVLCYGKDGHAPTANVKNSDDVIEFRCMYYDRAILPHRVVSCFICWYQFDNSGRVLPRQEILSRMSI